MGTQAGKMTVSLPRHLILFTDQMAKQLSVSRSKVVSTCLQELAVRRLREEMEEGYRVMAEEHAKFAEMASAIAHEVIPEWR